MSLKVLCFGQSQFLKKVIGKLKNGRLQENDDEIVVDNIDVSGKSFLIFSISNPELIISQATGTSGLLYFLDASIPIYEQKQFFFNIIGQKKQFQGIPAVIVYDKDQKLNIKQIVNSFQLFKVKDRASMIRQVDFDEKDSITQIFGWIDSQIQFRKTRSFYAPPKIIKMKPKYRQSQPESNEKKYQSIIKQKKFKGIGVKSQQQAYIEMEKQRIKNQNMEKQLANFNKNKKKMAPYDIKATPNPKIDANLHFFLKDGKVDKAQQVNIKIQTDQFKEKPKQKQYIPKKTGVNIATQIQPTQLFDFTKQVQPILDILTTRALQAAALQIEQQQQILKIIKYKNAYSDRVKTQKKHENEKIQQQLQAIKQKERILQAAKKKDDSKKFVTKKQSYYSISNTFLQNIYKDSAISLYKKNFYPNQFEHALKTHYLPQILKRSLLSYQKMVQKQKCLQNVFEDHCVKPIFKQGLKLRQQNKNKKKQKQERRINKGDKTRFLRIYYESNQEPKFTSFAKYLKNQLDGNLDEYIKSRQDEIQEAEEKHQATEGQQSDLQKLRNKDNASYGQKHNSFYLQSKKSICFETTQNKYSPPLKSDNFIPGCLMFDREGNLLQNINAFNQHQAFAKGIKDLRFPKDPINFDNGLLINLQKIPDHLHSLIFYLKINQVQTYLGQTQIKNIKNSAYQLQFYQKAIPIFKQDIGGQIKWEELEKPIQGGAEGDEGKPQEKVNKQLYVLAYHIIKQGKQAWQIQQLNTHSKLIQEQHQPEFVDKISAFYKRSLEIFKTQDQQAKQATPRVSSRNTKRKSKKSIASEKQVPRAPPKLGSRILKEVQINLQDSWESTFNKLGESVTAWNDFIQNSPDGWCLQFRGKNLQSNQQIKKFNKVGDIKLKKVIPVIQEQEKQQAVEGENQQKQEES